MMAAGFVGRPIDPQPEKDMAKAPPPKEFAYPTASMLAIHWPAEALQDELKQKKEKVKAPAGDKSFATIFSSPFGAFFLAFLGSPRVFPRFSRSFFH